MKFGIEGKRALVTAGGRGRGRAIAESLAAEGAQVAVVSRTAATVDSVIDAIGGAGRGHLGITADLEADAAPSAVLALLERDFGSCDIVVHNLGGTLDFTDPFCGVAAWRRVWRVNLEVAVELNLQLLPPMQKRGWGRIVLISSISALENHGAVPYCSVKAALTAYARSMGRFVAPQGVVITAVLPGAVFTEGGYWETASRERAEHVQTYLRDRMAIHRFGHPAEIADVVTFLCSEQASFCVGSIVPVDGGQGRSYFGE